VYQKKIVIVTPWFDGFVGGAGTLAKGMAAELIRRGLSVSVFTTCSLSPYDDWWTDHYPAGESTVDGIPTQRFRVNQTRAPYDATIRKIAKGKDLTTDDEQNFFVHGINSDELVGALTRTLDHNHEVLALPYFQGLTHSALNSYPRMISLIPCFHDEPQFYWSATRNLLVNAKHIFYNSEEEKAMTIRQYGLCVGRRVVEGVVTGVGVEMSAAGDGAPNRTPLPASYFVYAGRKELGKNVALMCEWFIEYVRETGAQSKLVLLGGGDVSLLPRSLHVVDLGTVSEAAKRQVVRGARALINLSNNESFSIVIVEAWLLGVPVIASARCEVTTGHVRRANGGLFVNSREEFSTALAYLESNEEIRTQLGENGKVFAAHHFSYDQVLAKYLRVLSANGQP